ncbi:hypothetical protein PVT67_14675 [Gallaecimonas kandeliae]|uniref:hypothetical protein n=1 Tax=Gallaecimonas kandeliae TaxID=3029055 RepID=UPI002648120D|nr:hypothetical protein [Gallaecimonas kandeliae]WKE64898.1 hypothetical protein PVT67_14675 [Gallaecimonas kandeliae]
MTKTSSPQHQDSVSDFLEAQIPALLEMAESVLAYGLDAEQLQARLWDLLESWQALGKGPETPPSQEEKAFWNLVGLMNRHPPYHLRGNWAIRHHLETAIDYLRGDTELEPDGLALRP